MAGTVDSEAAKFAAACASQLNFGASQDTIQTIPTAVLFCLQPKSLLHFHDALIQSLPTELPGVEESRIQAHHGAVFAIWPMRSLRSCVFQKFWKALGLEVLKALLAGYYVWSPSVAWEMARSLSSSLCSSASNNCNTRSKTLR